MVKKNLLTGLIVSILCACSTNVANYSDNQPRVVMEEFFNGTLHAHGIVKNYSGKVIRHFSADIYAYWVDGIGTLDEDFVFNDGEKQKRVWTITPTESKNGVSSYEGTAGDVSKNAKIKVAGNAVFLDYTLDIPYKDSTLSVNVDDKMYLVNNDTIINESKLYKFGLPVGSITLTIIRAPKKAE